MGPPHTTVEVFAEGVHECRHGRVHVPRTVTAEHLATVLGTVAKEVADAKRRKCGAA